MALDTEEEGLTSKPSVRHEEQLMTIDFHYACPLMNWVAPVIAYERSQQVVFNELLLSCRHILVYLSSIFWDHLELGIPTVWLRIWHFCVWKQAWPAALDRTFRAIPACGFKLPTPSAMIHGCNRQPHYCIPWAALY